ncbi:hypothetical protein PUNSTDRAFT_47379 [Punctularia strigosozonata HHB-11173 SS5]|uniref:Uncharacterized protein n=1 Tax=Punctularia strigosozonata (strain HHB-11173) TaxID=741275 RepID=R7S4J2_PUNST|nr:uncharacterized protein PUNSTDRAFT_47379 [Punctularia strigosozonata HHB-11173 SS5]EIN04749.1 hypothetical protein PUNSTDRAFT_47379 [Punctularia strigosozonata HHB-11173 SS5]
MDDKFNWRSFVNWAWLGINQTPPVTPNQTATALPSPAAKDPHGASLSTSQKSRTSHSPISSTVSLTGPVHDKELPADSNVTAPIPIEVDPKLMVLTHPCPASSVDPRLLTLDGKEVDGCIPNLGNGAPSKASELLEWLYINYGKNQVLPAPSAFGPFIKQASASPKDVSPSGSRDARSGNDHAQPSDLPLPETVNATPQPHTSHPPASHLSTAYQPASSFGRHAALPGVARPQFDASQPHINPRTPQQPVIWRYPHAQALLVEPVYAQQHVMLPHAQVTRSGDTRVQARSVQPSVAHQPTIQQLLWTQYVQAVQEGRIRIQQHTLQPSPAALQQPTLHDDAQSVRAAMVRAQQQARTPPAAQHQAATPEHSHGQAVRTAHVRGQARHGATPYDRPAAVPAQRSSLDSRLNILCRPAVNLATRPSAEAHAQYLQIYRQPPPPYTDQYQAPSYSEHTQPQPQPISRQPIPIQLPNHHPPQNPHVIQQQQNAALQRFMRTYPDEFTNPRQLMMLAPEDSHLQHAVFQQYQRLPQSSTDDADDESSCSIVPASDQPAHFIPTPPPSDRSTNSSSPEPGPLRTRKQKKIRNAAAPYAKAKAARNKLQSGSEKPKCMGARRKAVVLRGPCTWDNCETANGDNPITFTRSEALAHVRKCHIPKRDGDANYLCACKHDASFVTGRQTMVRHYVACHMGIGASCAATGNISSRSDSAHRSAKTKRAREAKQAEIQWPADSNDAEDEDEM